MFGTNLIDPWKIIIKKKPLWCSRWYSLVRTEIVEFIKYWWDLTNIWVIIFKKFTIIG